MTILLLLSVLVVGFIPLAAAQTPAIINPPSIPATGIKFLDQQGYIVTIPPQGVQVQKEGGGPADFQEIILSLAASGAAFVSAKILGDKNHKANAAEILKGKENTKELARVTYNMNPEAAAKIDDAPTVKIQTLQNDVTDYAQKTAKK